MDRATLLPELEGLGSRGTMTSSLMSGNGAAEARDPLASDHHDHADHDLERDLDELAQLLLDIYLWQLEQARK